MLIMKEHCERCSNVFTHESKDVVICSFECTFCLHCARHALHFVCPNCQGTLENRPTRVNQNQQIQKK